MSVECVWARDGAWGAEWRCGDVEVGLEARGGGQGQSVAWVVGASWRALGEVGTSQ
jgi:hypothetical protein